MPIKFGIIYISVQILFAFVFFFSFTIKFHKKTSRIRIIPVFQYNLFIDFFLVSDFSNRVGANFKVTTGQ